MADLNLVHQLKGKHVVYVLALEAEDGTPRRYVGHTTNVERRMAEHTGMKNGGALWCKKHRPVDVLTCRIVDSKEEAAAMEVMLVSLHQAKTGYQATKGGRWNMSNNMKKKPPYFDNADEYFLSPRSGTSDEVETLEVPEMLPPNYDILKEENGITEDKPPKSCPCFRDERDPEGRLRHLAGLIMH